MSRWEKFWFAEVPPDAFELVRVAVGAGGLISLIGFLPIDMFWSPDGIAPLPGGGLGFRSVVFEAGLGTAVGAALFVALFVSFTCMTVGLFTGTAIIVCFLGTVFQARWNALPLTSGHTVLVAVLFCLLWADCSGRSSVDAWRQRRRGSIPKPETQPIWPLRLIRIQIGIMYLTSGFFKLLSAGWRSGATVHYTTTQNVYGRIFHVYPLPDSLGWTLTVLTYATLFWEISFPFLILHRLTRMAAILVGIGMHFGIWATMEVGPFSPMMLAVYAAFIDPDKAPRVVDWLSRRVRARRTPAVAAQGTAADSTSAA